MTAFSLCIARTDPSTRLAALSFRGFGLGLEGGREVWDVFGWVVLSLSLSHESRPATLPAAAAARARLCRCTTSTYAGSSRSRRRCRCIGVAPILYSSTALHRLLYYHLNSPSTPPLSSSFAPISIFIIIAQLHIPDTTFIPPHPTHSHTHPQQQQPSSVLHHSLHISPP